MPLVELSRNLQALGARVPNSNNPSTRKWVKKMNQVLDDLPDEGSSGAYSDQAFQLLVSKHVDVLTHEIKRLMVGQAGWTGPR